jgi:tetratricopeptide (TPR) repeat protein
MKYELVSMTRKPFDWKNIILFFKSIGYCVCVCLFPTHLGVHHTYLERYGLTKEETKFALKFDGFLVLGLIITITMVYMFFWHWGNPITYGLFWFFLFYIPWANVCTIHQAFAERYVVLSLIGIMYAFVNIIVQLPLTYAIAIYYGFVGYYACRTQLYIKIYADVLRCAEHNCENFEDSAAAWRWRGGLERNLGLINEAFISWMKAWRLRPYDFVLCNNIASILCQRGQWEEAQKFMDMAKQCPLPTKDLEAKWKVRQDEFQRVYDEHKKKREEVERKLNAHPRNAICPECKIKYKRCKHGGNNGI